MRCHAAYSTSDTHHRSRPIPHASAVPLLVPIPSPTPSIIPDEASSDDEYRPVDNDDRIEDAFSDGVDPADAMDAEAFEMLSRGVDISPSYLPRQGSAVELPLPAILEDPGQPPTRIEAGKSGVTVIIDRFPLGSPGAPIAGPPTLNGSSLTGTGDSTIWAPFQTQCDWQFAHWAKTRGPTSSAVGDLLAIPEVCAPFSFFTYHRANVRRKVVERLDLSYRTTRELNSIIDNNLPGPPSFQCRELVIGHERLQFFCRDTLLCIRSLYGTPEFMQYLVFAPEQHYTDSERTCRVVNEMHTGDWWWTVQVRNIIIT
jgi:hypothetical protein